MGTSYKVLAGQARTNPVFPDVILVEAAQTKLDIAFSNTTEMDKTLFRLLIGEPIANLNISGDTTTASKEGMYLSMGEKRAYEPNSQGGSLGNLTASNIDILSTTVQGTGLLNMLNATTSSDALLEGWKGGVTFAGSQAGTLKNVGLVTMTASSTAAITGVTGNVILLDASKGGAISNVSGSVSLKASTATSITSVTGGITLSDGAAGGAISKVAGNITANGGSFTTATGITGDVIVSGGGFFTSIDGADDVTLNGARASGTYNLANIRGDITATDMGTRATLDVSNLTGKITANNLNLTLSGTIDRDLANITYGSGNTDRAATYTVDDRAGINDGSNAISIKLDGNANLTYKLANNTDHNTLTGVSKPFTIYINDVGGTTGEKQVVTIHAAMPAIDAGNLRVVITDHDSNLVEIKLTGGLIGLDPKYITYTHAKPGDTVVDPTPDPKPTDPVVDPFAGKLPADFNVGAYADYNPDLTKVLGWNASALKQHYIDYGGTEGRIYIDLISYAANNSDVFNAFGLNFTALWNHYQAFGRAEGRPIGTFQADAYVANNPDIYTAFGLDTGALVRHYITNGKAEGRVATGFDADYYAALHPDLAVAGLTTKEQLISHYVNFGKAEGRVATWPPETATTAPKAAAAPRAPEGDAIHFGDADASGVAQTDDSFDFGSDAGVDHVSFGADVSDVGFVDIVGHVPAVHDFAFIG